MFDKINILKTKDEWLLNLVINCMKYYYYY